jgi:c(7)-type cytochrome triheme protein
VSMDQMGQGESCGACHDGDTAFTVEDNCGNCHEGM